LAKEVRGNNIVGQLGIGSQCYVNDFTIVDNNFDNSGIKSIVYNSVLYYTLVLTNDGNLFLSDNIIFKENDTFKRVPNVSDVDDICAYIDFFLLNIKGELYHMSFNKNTSTEKTYCINLQKIDLDGPVIRIAGSRCCINSFVIVQTTKSLLKIRHYYEDSRILKNINFSKLDYIYDIKISAGYFYVFTIENDKMNIYVYNNEYFSKFYQTFPIYSKIFPVPINPFDNQLFLLSESRLIRLTDDDLENVELDHQLQNKIINDIFAIPYYILFICDDGVYYKLDDKFNMLNMCDSKLIESDTLSTHDFLNEMQVHILFKKGRNIKNAKNYQ